MTITTAQIRGARGILNWSQQDLSDRTDISTTSIGSIEKGATKARASTLEVILSAFESAGIDFTAHDGVRKKQGLINVYAGSKGLIDFYDDIYNTAKTKPGDILVSNVDERPFVKWLGDYAQIHIDRMKALTPQTKYRILSKQGDSYTPGEDYAEYRWIPNELFASVPFYLYGDKLAILIFDSEPTVICLHYSAIASAYKVQFEDMWARSQTINK